MAQKSARMVLAAAAVLSFGKMSMGQTPGFSKTLSEARSAIIQPALTLKDRMKERPKIAPPNFGMVSEGIYRGGRPKTAGNFDYLKNLGVSTVIDLEYFHEDSPVFCRPRGLNCVREPLLLFPFGDEFFNWKTFREAFRLVLSERAQGRVVYFHCKDGSDRTGALAAALMIRNAACGVPLDAAARNALWTRIDQTLSQYGFHEVFAFLHEKIKSWIYDPSNNRWLCR